jgi:serine-protein kinase ATM
VTRRKTTNTVKGRYISEARLESAEEITRNYLEPALKGLKGNHTGEDVGHILHEFAVFCDKQLHNSDFTDEFERVSKAREKRKKEVDAYLALLQLYKGKPEKEKYAKEYKISKKWQDLDDEEYHRMKAARQSQIVQCIENYLRSLAISTHFDGDVLRFFSIWLECKDNEDGNLAVAEHLQNVPSSKFAILMNQLTAILEDKDMMFYAALSKLIKRICKDHPHHSLHNIFAGVHAPTPDETAQSRKRAMKNISGALQADKSFRDIFSRIFKGDSMYHALAVYKDKNKGLQAGLQVLLETLSPSLTLMRKIPDLKLPPATLNIPPRADRDYSSMPLIVSFKPRMSIASGISAPKIVTAIASDGLPYKQLVSY